MWHHKDKIAGYQDTLWCMNTITVPVIFTFTDCLSFWFGRVHVLLRGDRYRQCLGMEEWNIVLAHCVIPFVGVEVILGNYAEELLLHIGDLDARKHHQLTIQFSCTTLISVLTVYSISFASCPLHHVILVSWRMQKTALLPPKKQL